MKPVFMFLFALNLALAGYSNTSLANNADAGETANADGASVTLSPDNTKIGFVGTHSGEKPDPRKGGFKKFSGTATVADKKLKAIKVEIDTASLYTEIDKLTNHLKTPDFFDVRRFPKATFESTAIEPADGGKVKITGNLKLLKETQSITFLADVDASDKLKFAADFTIDRTKFGMTYGKGQVENEVALSVHVGK